MPERILDGLRRFRRETFPRWRERYARLVAEGQRPSTLFIGCADSRILPDLMTGAEPGELFIVRNMGAFVPPFEGDAGYHGTSAAIEFATLMLGVTDIVVCGHTHCGAIRALYDEPRQATPHITAWLELGREARMSGPPEEEALRRSERYSVGLQLARLITYPMVAEGLERGDLAVHGWIYVLEEGRVEILDVERGEFVPVSED